LISLITHPGYRVAQVRMLFQVNLPCRHEKHGVFFALIHWFTLQLAKPENSIDMYVVKRLTRTDGSPFEDVIEVTSIERIIQLIPRFASNTADLEEYTPDHLMESCDRFLINSFADKETYAAVY
jgi:hypothetical protein